MAYKHLTQTATAGNVDTSFQPSTGESFNIIYGQVIYAADATVANRRVIIQVLAPDGSTIVGESHAGAVITASQTIHNEFMRGVFRETTAVGDALQIPIPFDFIVPASDWTLNITIENGQAGDSYTTNFLVDES